MLFLQSQMQPQKFWILLLSSSVWNIIPGTFSMPPPGRRPYPEMSNFYPQDLSPLLSSGLKGSQTAAVAPTRNWNRWLSDEGLGFHDYHHETSHHDWNGIMDLICESHFHSDFKLLLNLLLSTRPMRRGRILGVLSYNRTALAGTALQQYVANSL
jgi:hypothetical protein